MITRKLILWTSNLIILLSLIITSIEVFYITTSNKSDKVFIYLISLQLFLLLVGVIGSIFALDNTIFLKDYDAIKEERIKLDKQMKIVTDHIVIIGQHEAMKLWNAARNPISEVKKDIPLEIKKEISLEVKKEIPEEKKDIISPSP